MDMITKNLKGFDIKLKIKAGVFTKGRVDDGTRLLLDVVKTGDKTLIADLGCGGGVLGIAVAKANPGSHIHLLDEHLRAVRLAEENVRLNNLKNAEVFLSDLFSAVADRKYDQILSNPPQHLGNVLLEEAAKESKNHLKVNGQVYWVVQQRIKPFFIRLFTKVFGNYEIISHGKGHVVIGGINNG